MSQVITETSGFEKKPEVETDNKVMDMQIEEALNITTEFEAQVLELKQESVEDSVGDKLSPVSPVVEKFEKEEQEKTAFMKETSEEVLQEEELPTNGAVDMQESKSEDIDEFIVVVVPPGQEDIESNNDELEEVYEEIQRDTPKIKITPSFDEADELVDEHLAGDAAESDEQKIEIDDFEVVEKVVVETASSVIEQVTSETVTCEEDASEQKVVEASTTMEEQDINITEEKSFVKSAMSPVLACSSIHDPIYKSLKSPSENTEVIAD